MNRLTTFVFTGVAVFACLTLSGCSLFAPWGSLYSGDGTYVKAPGMFQVRLAEIPTDLVGQKCTKLSRLGPDWVWVVSVRLESTDGNNERLYNAETSNLKKEFIPRAKISLTLVNDENQTVFSESGPLNEWSWNWNRARKEGRGEEYASAPGTYSFRRFEVGPDDGWGTSFSPRYEATYTLCYSVSDPVPTTPGTVLWLTAETYIGSL